MSGFKSLAITLLLFFVGITTLAAQSLQNKGVDFWFAYTEVFDHTAAVFKVHISGNVNTSGTVSIPGTGFTQNFTVTPNIVTTVTIPSADANNIESDSIMAKAIHVISSDTVSVFAHTFHLYRSEASVVLPVASLGSDYWVTAFENTVTAGRQSEFVIVSQGKSIQLIITSPVATEGGHSAGIPWLVTLDSGDVYMVQAANGAGNDLTGSRVRALNGTDVFAIYSGHVFTNVSCASNLDPLYEIIYPISTWGTDYILIPTEGQNYNYFRVMSSAANTTITINGSNVGTYNAGQFYADTVSKPTVISASDPVSVMQYMTSGACTPNSPYTVGTNGGDPSMVMLTPNNQMFVDSATFYAIHDFAMDTALVIFVARTPDTATVTLNGSTVTNWNVLTPDPSFSWRIIPLGVGNYTMLTTSKGIAAYSYAFQWAESYFYSVGVYKESPTLLPVALRSFLAEQGEDRVLTKWKTLEEKHNSHFQILRSRDGMQFQPIGTVRGNGDSDEEVAYEFEDLNPLAGRSYYRLRQFDHNSLSVDSRIVTVLFEGKDLRIKELKPIPAISNLDVRFETPLDGKIEGEITDMLGRVLLRFSQTVQSGPNTIELDLAALPSGTYLIFIGQAGIGKICRKFIKQ